MIRFRRTALTTRLPALLTGLTAALALAACAVGVPPSDVIEAGGPGTGMTAQAVVYFVSDRSLVAVPLGIQDPLDLPTALRLLFGGPAGAGMRNAAGRVTTELPRLEAPAVALAVRPDAVLVRLPSGVGRLTELGLRQLVCTVAGVRSTFQTASPTTQPVPVQPTREPVPRAVPPTGLPSAAPGPDAGIAPVTGGHVSVVVTADGWQQTAQSDSCPAR